MGIETQGKAAFITISQFYTSSNISEVKTVFKLIKNTQGKSGCFFFFFFLSVVISVSEENEENSETGFKI